MSKTVTVNYEVMHTQKRTEKWSQTEIACPKCAARNVWRPEPYETRMRHLCLSCSTGFALELCDESEREVAGEYVKRITKAILESERMPAMKRSH